MRPCTNRACLVYEMRIDSLIEDMGEEGEEGSDSAPLLKELRENFSKTFFVSELVTLSNGW